MPQFMLNKTVLKDCRAEKQNKHCTTHRHAGIPTPCGTYWHHDGTAEATKDVTVALGAASVAFGLNLTPSQTGIPTPLGTHWHHEGTADETLDLLVEFGAASVAFGIPLMPSQTGVPTPFGTPH